MQDNDGMFFFSGYFDAINAIRTKSGKWDMVKAIYLYSTQGALPDEKIAKNSVFLLIKAVIDGRNKKSSKGGKVDEKEDMGNTKTSGESSDTCTKKVVQVSTKSVADKKVAELLDNKNRNRNINRNKNINKNKKEIEKEIYKEKEQEKSSSSSSNCSVEILQEATKEEDDDKKKGTKSKSKKVTCSEDKKCEVNCSSVPSLEKVVCFVNDAGLVVSPEAFYSYYQAKNWEIKGEPIKDWRACILTWNKMLDMSKNSSKAATGLGEKSTNLKGKSKSIEYRGKKYTQDEFDKMFFDSFDNIEI